MFGSRPILTQGLFLARSLRTKAPHTQCNGCGHIRNKGPRDLGDGQLDLRGSWASALSLAQEWAVKRRWASVWLGHGCRGPQPPGFVMLAFAQEQVCSTKVYASTAKTLADIGGVSDAVRARCGNWGCSVDPFI